MIDDIINTRAMASSSSAMHWLRSRSCAAVVGGLLSGWLAPQVLQLQQQQQQQQQQPPFVFSTHARAVHTVCHSAGSVAPVCRQHKVIATTPLLDTQTLATSSSDDSNSSSDSSPDADNDSEHGVPFPTLSEDVIISYENRLRMNASQDKVFKYFASVVVDKEEYLTPQDFAAIFTSCYVGGQRAPINIPLFEDTARLQEAAAGCPRFFSFRDPDNPAGLISFERFVAFTTLLAIPRRNRQAAFLMFDRDLTKLLNASEFQLMLATNLFSKDVDDAGNDEGLLRHLFGPKMDKTLTVDRFEEFLEQLSREVMLLSFDLLNPTMRYGKGTDGRGTISARDFLLSVVSHASPNLRPTLVKRVAELDKSGALKGKRVTFQDYYDFDEFAKQADAAQYFITLYSHQNGNFTRTNLVRVAAAVASVHLSPMLVGILFDVFAGTDKNIADQKLFMNAMRNRQYLQAERALGMTFGGTLSCMQGCMSRWYHGTAKLAMYSADPQAQKQANQ